jgi:hypothetical protein
MFGRTIVVSLVIFFALSYVTKDEQGGEDLLHSATAWDSTGQLAMLGTKLDDYAGAKLQVLSSFLHGNIKTPSKRSTLDTSGADSPPSINRQIDEIEIRRLDPAQIAAEQHLYALLAEKAAAFNGPYPADKDKESESQLIEQVLELSRAQQEQGEVNTQE